MQDSEWAPYISRLPRPEEMHNTVSVMLFNLPLPILRLLLGFRLNVLGMWIMFLLEKFSTLCCYSVN